MSRSTSTAPPPRSRATGTTCATNDAPRSGVELRPPPAPAARRQARRRAAGDVGLAHELHVVRVAGVFRQAQHLASRGIGQHQPSGRVDEQHAFGHAGEDRVRVRALARHVRSRPPSSRAVSSSTFATVPISSLP